MFEKQTTSTTVRHWERTGRVRSGAEASDSIVLPGAGAPGRIGPEGNPQWAGTAALLGGIPRRDPDRLLDVIA